MRTLLIVLVVLAVAEPYGERLVAGGASTPAHKVLVIDGSLSMAYRENGTSNFDRAKKLAVGLVRDSRAGDTFSIVVMSTPAQIIIDRPSGDVSAVIEQIESLTETHTSAELPAALSLVQQVLATQATDQSTPQRNEVYFFSDLQQSTWQLETTLIAALAQRAALFVVDVGQPNAANLAVTHLAASEPFVTVNRDVAWEVTLRQFGAQPLPDCRVELLVDDAAVGEQTIDVPAGGEASVQFSHRFTTAGNHSLAVRASGDRLEPDNARWMVVPVRDEIRVLCVEGREGAAKYVAAALNPNPATSSAIRPIIASEGEFAEITLNDFDCVFLCNVPQITASEALRLARFAAGGGGVVFFLGDRVVAESYYALATGSHAERGNEKSVIDAQPLIPARVGELVTQPSFGLDPLGYRHAIVAPFRGNERAGLLTTPVSRYFRLDVPKQSRNVEIAAAIGRGDPFIVTAPLGKGRTLLVATDGSLTSVDAASGEPWTIWPTWPSFLPIIHELLAYAIGGKHQQWQQTVGTPIASQVIGPAEVAAGANSDTILRILRPDGNLAPVALKARPGELRWSYSNTELAGIYSLSGQPPESPQQFALNVDTSESNLTRIESRKVPRELVVRNTQSFDEDKSPTTLVKYDAWSGRLLWLAIVLLFIESYFAWRFGRGT
jgi:hypothetical protein